MSEHDRAQHPRAPVLERAESEAWAEIQGNVSEAFGDRFGIRVHRIGGTVALVAPLTDMLALNRVWLPGDAATLHESVLDEVIVLFRESGAQRFVAHWPSSALPMEATEWFMGRGFRTGHPMAKLCRSTSAPVAIRSACEIAEIGVTEAEQFGAIAALGNELPPYMASGFTSTIGLAGWRHYLAMDDGIPIAAAALRVAGDIGWCGFAGTLPAHRGRGAQGALLARRVRDAAAAGCAWVTCETMADTVERPSQSFRNMTRLGFEVAYMRATCVLDLR